MPAPAPIIPMHRFRKLLEYSSSKETFAIRIIAGIVFLNGLAAIFEVLLTRVSPRFSSFLPLDYELYGRYFGLFTGFVLIYISTRLLLRKRFAWWISVCGSAGIILAHIFYFHTEVAIILPFAALVLLGLYHEEFVAESEPSTMRRGLWLLAGCFIVALLYGSIGFSRLKVHDISPQQHFSISQGLDRTVREFTLLGNDDISPKTHTARWFLNSLDLLGATSLGFALFSIFRPLRYRYSVLPQDRERARQLLEQYGCSSEDAFKLWPEDKSYFFLSSGDAFVAYLVQSGSALVLGEPIGPIDKWPRLLQEFNDYCRRHDWLVAMIYLPPQNLQIIEDADMRSLKIGEDAIVETRLFSTKTSHNKHFRAVRNKFVRLGYRYEMSTGPHSPELLRETARVSRSWLGSQDRRERGFALGYYNRGYLNRTKLHLLYGPDNRLVAFANEIRSYNPNQATIDLMRHTRSTETGAMDYLQMRIIEQTFADGVAEFSLGIAPLAGLMDEESRPIEQRFLHYIAVVGVGGFAYEGLRRYKNKFEPRWEDRYMAYAAGPVGFLRSGNALNSIVN